MSEYIKWLLVWVVALAGVASSVYFMDQSFLIRLTIILASMLVATAIGFTTTGGAAALKVVKLSPNEIKKVSWPTRNEVVQITIIVVIMVSILMFMVWGVDSILLKLISLVTRQGV